MLIIGFLDRVLDVIGILYIIKATWMVAKGYGIRRSLF